MSPRRQATGAATSGRLSAFCAPGDRARLAAGAMILAALLVTLGLPSSGAESSSATFTFTAPQASRVEIMGSWNGWAAPTALAKGAGGTWSARLPLAPGSYQYKFVIDGAEWVLDPANPRKIEDGLGGFNSVVDVAASAAPQAASAAAARAGSTVFTVEAPGARTVEITGSWDNWSVPVAGIRSAGGRWAVSIPLVPGSYDYVVVTDGEWNELQKVTVGGGRATAPSASAAAPPSVAPAPATSAPPAAAVPARRGTLFSVEAPGARAVDVMGSWNNWSAPTLLVKGADGLWTATIDLPNGTYEYKFRQDGDWDKLNTDNRKITVPSASAAPPATSTPSAPAASASATSGRTVAAGGDIPVVFRFRSPSARTVHVAGEFNAWLNNDNGRVTGNEPWLMQNDGTGLWTITALMKAGRYKFKYVVNGTDWQKDPSMPESNDDNSLLDVTPGGAAATPAPAPSASTTAPTSERGAVFTVEAPGAGKVDIMGSWNSWSAPTDMVKGADGRWTATMQLAPGAYEYKFRQDGDWDKLNTDNRKATVGADGRIVAGAGASSPPPAGGAAAVTDAAPVPAGTDFTQTAAVVLPDERVLFGFADPFANSVSIGGDFNGWDPGKTKLIRNAEGAWVGVMTLKEGRYGWKFVVDGQWESGDNRKLTIVRGRAGRLEVLPDQPSFNTPYNSRIYFSGRFYGQAVLRTVPSGEKTDTGRTRFAPLEYNLIPRMLFTVGDNITGYMEADVNQHEGRFETNFSEGEVTLDEGWGRASIFRRRRIADFNDPMRLLDPFRDTLDDAVYFTTEERPSTHRFGRQFDDVRRNTDDNYTGSAFSGWQGLYGELNIGKWKFQALGSDHIIGQEDLWGARAQWNGRFLRVGTSYVYSGKPRGLIAERNWAGGDVVQTTAFVDTSGGYFTSPGTSDHYSYDSLYHLTPNGSNYDQWWGVDLRVGSDTRHVFGELVGRRKQYAFLAYENGDGLRPNGTSNYFSWSYFNAGEYLIGGRERDLSGVFGAVYFPMDRLGLEISYRLDDGTALTLDRNRNLVNVSPSKNTLTLRGRYLSERFKYGIEAVRRTVSDFPNAILAADFDNYDFADVSVFGASDMMQFKQDLFFRIGRWSLEGSHRYRDYTLLAKTLQSTELRGILGFDLTRRIQLSLSGRYKTYALPNDATLTREPNQTKRFYELGGRVNYAVSKYVSLNFGYGVNFRNDEDIEEGQLFFLRSALARARRGPPAYGGGAITRTLDQVIEAERILGDERRVEFNVDARF